MLDTSVNWGIFLFKAIPDKENGHSNIKLIRVKSVNKANLSVTFDGSVECFLGGNSAAVNTNPFMMSEKSTYAKQICMKSNGEIYSIDYCAVISYALQGLDYESLDVYKRQFANTKKMYERMKEKRETSWSLI